MTSKNKILVVYGTLKKGQYNHDFLKGQKFLGKTSVSGVMQMCGSYPHLFDPYAVRKPAVRHKAEVYSVSPEVYEGICDMEIGAGYYLRDVSTDWGMGVMFLTQPVLFKKDGEIVREFL
jgi:gamma-glutamylcyclotransferase (GGCT)/AIG2-like uncharacterized protein YtfP